MTIHDDKEIVAMSTAYILDDKEIYFDLLKGLNSFNNPRELLDINAVIMMIINIINNYFKSNKNAKYKDLLDALKEDIVQELTPKEERIRGVFGMILNEYLYLKSKNYNLTQKQYINLIRNYQSYNVKMQSGKFYMINEQERQAYMFLGITGLLDQKNREKIISAPINIKDIKGLGIGMCLEYSMLFQNLLSFLGYNTYMISGRFKKDDKEISGYHTWNVIESAGNFFIMDSINRILGPKIEGIQTSEELIKFGGVIVDGIEGFEPTYLSFFNTNQELKILAEMGKIERGEAKQYLNRLKIYKELHVGGEDKGGK